VRTGHRGSIKNIITVQCKDREPCYFVANVEAAVSEIPS